MICPNISLKEVKDGFNEMVEALGGRPLTDEEFRSSELRNKRTGSDYSAMEAAYRSYHRNNGNMLDKAPNGKDSVLFNSLLEYFKGDRAAAIKAKANVYTNEFFNWFGNWTGTAALVKYYGPTMGKTTAVKDNPNLVDFDDIVRDRIKKLAKEKNLTVRLLKMQSPPEYKQLLLDAIQEWKKSPESAGKTLLVSNAAISSENIYVNTPSIPSRSEFIRRLVERGEGDESAAAQYYDDLLSKWNPNLKIDDRYVSDIEGVSKIVDENGEPLVVYRGDKSNKTEFTPHYVAYNVAGIYTTGNSKLASTFAKREDELVYPVFVNSKNPFTEEHLKKENIYNMRSATDIWHINGNLSEYDGWIYGNLLTNGELVVDNPNQIKHAIYNIGTYSESNNIYYNLPIKNAAEEIKRHLLDRGIVHNFKGLRITKRVQNAELLVELACSGTSVFPVFYQGLNSTLVEFIDNVTIAEDLRDEIQRTNDKEIATIMSMCRTLLQKIPQMKFNIIRPSLIPQGVRKDAISFVKGDTVYIVQGRCTTETVVEEFMHPIVHCIQAANTSLFEDLLEEAKRDFPKLWAEIKDTYIDKEGFNESDRANELVTQALSRYVHSGYSKALKRNRVKDLVKKALNHIVKLLNNAIQRIGGKYIVTPEDLPKMTLGLLSQLFLADDTQFRVWTSEEVKYNIISHLQRALQVADNITKRFNVLYRAYEKAPDKTPRKQLILNRIFETFNELKRSKDYHSVQIALNFALENLGSWDDATNTPDNIDSISGYLWLQSQLADPYSGITPEILVEMYSNSIGFYDNLISKYIPENIDDMMTEEDRKLKSQLKTLIDDIIKPMWLKAMAVVGDKIVDLIVDQEVTKSDFEKELMKKVAKDWLHKNIMYGDISSVTAYLYNYSYSSNPIIKQAFHLILHAETKTLEEVLPIATRITRVFQKANKGMKRIGPNWQTILMEFDRDGIPTGNFVRDINYGQYEKDLEDFIKDLNKRFETIYKHTYIDDGNGCIINSLTGELAEDEEWENGIEPLYITYMKEIERWKCEHANRRYTFNYYEERMSEPYKGSMDPNDVDVNKFGHGLSPKTLAKYNYIQSNINYYLDLCTDPKTGFSHPEELSIQDKKKLDDWQSQLEDLQNPYNQDGTPKLDEDRQMAFEIRAWLKWLGERLVTRIDLDSFNSEYQSVVNKAQQANNPRLISDFMRYNSELGINPDFIELTIGLFANIKSSDLLAIHAELIRRSLQNLIKVKNGYTRDLGRMENNPSFWLDCKRTDQIIEDSRLKQSEAFAKMFDENFYFEQILYRDPNGFAIDANGNQVQPQDEAMHNDLLTYHEYMISKYTKDIYNSPTRTFPGLNDDQGNPIVFNGTINEVRSIVEKLFTYRKERTDMDGNIIVSDEPLSIFSMLKPRPDTFFNVRTGRTEPTFLQVPKGRFAEKHDHAGVYMNQDYDHKDLNSELPMRQYYDNTEAYNKVTKDADVEHLYDTLIEVMQEMLANYLSTNRRFNYRLPQVNAHTMQILSRITHQGFGNTMSKLWQSSTTVEENDESMRTNEDYATNPDGSIATDVPLKFVRKLKNPEDITTDVVGSVILFANMALNYKNKSEIDARIKALRFNLDFLNREELYKQTSKEDDEELAPNDNENSIKMFDSMANKHMYGNQWTGNPNQPKGSNKQANTNSWRGIASSALVTGTAFAGLGALFGLPLFGTITTGAILGGSLGAVIGGLLGAIQNGLFEGVALFKTIKNVLRIETSQTLALNIYSMLVGFGDSTTRILKESLMGKYMTIRDILTSFAYVIWLTPRCIANIGNPLANNKLTRAMQLNGVSKGIHLTYEHLNYGRVRRVASNLLMGGFSLLDWMANALLMRSFYNNVRFYDGDVVPKGFYSRYELEQAFMNAGHSKSAAKFAHMLCTTTLWGAYNNKMYIKPEYEQYVTQRLKTLVRTKTLKRGALYNGMNPDNDVPIWKLDLIGGIVGALRSWLAQSMQHLYAGGVDNIVKEYSIEQEQEVFGSKTKQKQKRKVRSITNEERSRLFAWDYETGTTQDQILIGIVRSFRTLSNWIQLHIFLFGGSKEDNTKAKLSEVEKYAWTDIIIYLGVLIAMMIGWTHVHDWASDVPKPEDRYHNSPVNLSPKAVYQYMRDVYIPREYYKLAVDNIMFRTIESLLTSFLPSSMSDIVSSVTALTNGVNEHLGVYGAVMDITGLSGHKLSDLIKLGGYKFYSRGERFGYKFIGPLDNLHTFLSYYGTVTNRDFYINTFGGAFKAFGYDFKKAKEESNKKGKSKKSTGSGFGGFDGGSGGGFDTGSGGFGGF